MRVKNTESISFKSAYLLKGSSDTLGEICWYMQKKKLTPNCCFDFLDIRVVKKSLTPTQKLLGKTSFFTQESKKSGQIIDDLLDSIYNSQKKDKYHILKAQLTKESSEFLEELNAKAQIKNDEENILNHLFDLISIRKGDKAPFPVLKTLENMDLFVTADEKKATEDKMVNMVEETLGDVFSKYGFKDGTRVLLDNLSQMRQGLSEGKPIVNIKASVAKKHLGFLNLDNLKAIDAEEAFEGIRSGKFDIVSGKM